MQALVIAFMALTAFAVIGTIAYMVLTALDPRYVPERLRPLQRRLQAHMFPEQVRERERAERASQKAAEASGADENPLSIFDSLFTDEPELPEASSAAMRSSTPTLTSGSQLPQAEVLLFLRAEIAIQLGFELDIRGATANLTPKQYRQLVEYTGFAFDAIESPESYLSHYGITSIHLVPRRGGFGYHSIGGN